MIKFESIPDIEKEPVIEEGKPYIDKNGNMNVILTSNVKCVFDPKFDNGNHVLSGDLAKIVKENKVFVCNRILDYCPGYGSVGLDMLALGVTNHVTFVDTDEKPVLNCLETSKNNSILFHTTGYGIDSISDLPEEEKYDVIIATMQGVESKYIDFFANIFKYCTIYADIYLIENKDIPKFKDSNHILLKNLYFLKSFPLQGKVIMHYKLSHDHLK